MVSLLDVYKEEEKAVANPLKCIGHLNAAMCQLKRKQYAEARKHCDNALEIDSRNVKGLFRRGQVANLDSFSIFSNVASTVRHYHSYHYN